MSASPARYAVYFSPEPEHPLWVAGCRWLGRDPSDPGFAGVRRAFTDDPRRYGFHATLRAPAALRDGVTPAQYLAAVQALADATPVFDMPVLQVSVLRRFVALLAAQPVAADHPLRRLADTCVRELDAYRAPLSAADRERRLAEPALDAQQRGNISQWGYPHVFDRWTFHMTLSDAIDDAPARRRVVDEASGFFAEALARPLRCESLCIFAEPERGAPFALAHRLPLRGGGT